MCASMKSEHMVVIRCLSLEGGCLTVSEVFEQIFSEICSDPDRIQPVFSENIE